MLVRKGFVGKEQRLGFWRSVGGRECSRVQGMGGSSSLSCWQEQKLNMAGELCESVLRVEPVMRGPGNWLGNMDFTLAHGEPGL